MKKIVLIGAGQLGSRHLQALSRISFNASIEVVDPLKASRDLARNRYDEMPANPNIEEIRYLESISQLAGKIDLAIIATNADIRANVIRDLIAQCEVKNLVLEKILFQDIEAYQEIQTLLDVKEVKSWVNHPRRMFPYYLRLAKLLSGSSQISFKVQGGDWGMACNALHFIDLFAFLTGGCDLEINASELNAGVIKAGREGYLEVNGTLYGKVSNNPFEIFCHKNPLPLLITICGDDMVIVIDEQNGLVRISKKENHWQWTEEKEKIIYFQSELSNKVAEDIIILNKCDLPTFSEASILHMPFIQAILKHINCYSNEKYAICPIT